MDVAECVSIPGDFVRPQGAFPLAFTSFGGLGSSPGAVGIFGNAGRVWAPALHSDPPKKALCHTCLLGGASIKYHRSISVLSEQYETSHLFYVTVSFLCNIICYLISVFAFSFVTLSGVTTYWWRGTRTKKGTLQQAKGVNDTGKDTSQQQRDTQLQVVKESTTKFQHTTNWTRFFVKQLQGIKLYKRRSVSDSGYLKKESVSKIVT